MEPRQKEEKKPSRAELERRVQRLNELLQGKLKDHVDGDAEEYLFKTIMKPKKGSGSYAEH